MKSDLMGDIDPATAGSVGELWSELNLGQLLEGVKETNKRSAQGLTQTKDPFAGHKKILANPSYNAVMGRYKTGPRGPKIVTKETLNRLSDPARGKFTSPSREAEKDAMFKAEMRRKRADDAAGDGTSFFLTEMQDGQGHSQGHSQGLAGSRPPAKSSFRTRLEQVARAAESINEDAPLSPAGNRYTSAQRVAEARRKARLMENLLHGQDAVRGARQSAKQNSQSRQAAARLSRVKNAVQSKPAPKKSRYDTGGSQMSRNRQAKLDSQAKIMRGRSRDTASYDARTGRVHSNRSSSRTRDVSHSREPSEGRGRNARDRSVDRASARGRSTDRSTDSVTAGSVRGRSNGRPRPDWVENPNAAADREAQRKDALAKQREERRKAFAARKAKNEKACASSVRSNRSNSSAEGSVKKVPTGVMSGSRSAASIHRKPTLSNNASYHSDHSTERRARTEQRSKKGPIAPLSAASARRQVGRRTPLKTHVEGDTPPPTVDSEANSSLQYSVSSKGSPGGKAVRGSAGAPVSDSRRRLLEKKGLPTQSAPALPSPQPAERSSSRTRSTKPAIPGRSSTGIAGSSAGVSTESKFPERFRASDRDELIGSIGRPLAEQLSPGAQAAPAGNVEMALRRAEEMSRALHSGADEGGGGTTDQDTLAFASLLATHAKRISGKLETAQSMDESYKKLTGALL